MIQRYHNPFAGIDLYGPVDQREVYDRYCQTHGRALIDQSPFPRMVDFWFAGLALAARKGLKPIDLGKDPFKFIDGSIFDRDSWRVQAVMLIAIAVEGNVDIVGEPRKIIALANGLAAAGIPHVVDMLRDGDQDPIWNLSQALDDLLSKKAA
ncbi:hypothetical protein NP284_35905 [Rhodopseudomonas pseudopalustris]|uniref:hypothetical protein n=1 Tax=Rhodopseudomonas pseudopalustris TaxID=1513892 RepID=UPI003F98EC18